MNEDKLQQLADSSPFFRQLLEITVKFERLEVKVQADANELRRDVQDVRDDLRRDVGELRKDLDRLVESLKTNTPIVQPKPLSGQVMTWLNITVALGTILTGLGFALKWAIETVIRSAQ